MEEPNESPAQGRAVMRSNTTVPRNKILTTYRNPEKGCSRVLSAEWNSNASTDGTGLSSQISEFDKMLNDLLLVINESEGGNKSEDATKTQKGKSGAKEKQQLKGCERMESIESISSVVFEIPNPAEISVYCWLCMMRMEYLESDFNMSGFDDAKFIRDIMEKKDLSAIGIYDDNEIAIIMKYVEMLPLPPPLCINSVKEFDAKYLTSLCDLDYYLDTFIEQGYETYDMISSLTDVTFIVVLDVHQIGHRKRFMYYIKKASEMLSNSKMSTCRSLSAQSLDESPPPPLPPSSQSPDISSSNCNIAVSPASDEFNSPSSPTAVECEDSTIKAREYQRTTKQSASNPVRVPEGGFSCSLSPEDKTMLQTEGQQPSDVPLTGKTSVSPKSLPLSSMKRGVTKKIGSFISKILRKDKKKMDSNNDSERSDSVTSDYVSECDSNFRVLTVQRRQQNLRGPNMSRCRRHLSQTGSAFVELISPSHDIWVHSSEELADGRVTISALYLGMHPVTNIMSKNKSMVKEAFEKLKSTSLTMNKVPQVNIVVSTCDIKLEVPDANSIICCHSINSILFCAQDIVDQRVFCYVYHEENSNKFLCNVFRSGSVKVSADAILAIGQAFELNFALYL